MKRSCIALVAFACLVTGCHKGDGGNGAAAKPPFTEAELGLPFYPSSQEMENASGTLDTPSGKSFRSVRTTKDDPMRVMDFYKDKVGSQQATHSESSGNQAAGINGKLADGSDVALSALKGGSKDTIVTVTVTHYKK